MSIHDENWAGADVPCSNFALPAAPTGDWLEGLGYGDTLSCGDGGDDTLDASRDHAGPDDWPASFRSQIYTQPGIVFWIDWQLYSGSGRYWGKHNDSRRTPRTCSASPAAVAAFTSSDTIRIASGYEGHESVDVKVGNLAFNAPARVTGSS